VISDDPRIAQTWDGSVSFYVLGRSIEKKRCRTKRSVEKQRGGWVVGWGTLSAWPLPFKYITHFFKPHLTTLSLIKKKVHYFHYWT
jgi:hypothetical protein